MLYLGSWGGCSRSVGSDAFPPRLTLPPAAAPSPPPPRVELTLRTKARAPRGTGAAAAAAAAALAELTEGQAVRGRVKRVEKFGVFVELPEQGGVTGLAHVSELADDFVKDIGALFSVGQRESVWNLAGRLGPGAQDGSRVECRRLGGPGCCSASMH